jgi:hypothetical protein
MRVEYSLNAQSRDYSCSTLKLNASAESSICIRKTTTGMCASLLLVETSSPKFRFVPHNEASCYVHRTPKVAGAKADAEAIVEAMRTAATFMVMDGLIVNQYIRKKESLLCCCVALDGTQRWQRTQRQRVNNGRPNSWLKLLDRAAQKRASLCSCWCDVMRDSYVTL